MAARKIFCTFVAHNLYSMKKQQSLITKDGVSYLIPFILVTFCLPSGALPMISRTPW